MRVAELMTRYVEFIDGEESVKAAAVLMGELDVGALTVGTAERLDGIVTDRDILYRVVARGLDAAAAKVGDVASRPVVACGESDTLQAAMDLMAAHHVRRLPVRDDAGVVTGWVTLADLSRQLLVGSEALQSALRDVTEAAG